MVICGNCGKEVEDGVKLCPYCGKEVDAAAAPAQEQEQEQKVDSQGGDDTKLMSILAYIFFFVPLLTGAYKKSDFIKFHANQGTVLFLASVAYCIVYVILSAILIFIPVIGWILITLLGIASLIFVVLVIMGIMNVVNNKMTQLPVIGKFTIIK